jgi:hypothetical protein
MQERMLDLIKSGTTNVTDLMTALYGRPGDSPDRWDWKEFYVTLWGLEANKVITISVDETITLSKGESK